MHVQRGEETTETPASHGAIVFNTQVRPTFTDFFLPVPVQKT